MNKKIFRLFVLAGFFSAMIFLLFWFSCQDNVTGPGPSDVVFPDSAVSYSQHVEVLFQQSCVSVGCHGGSNPGGNLNLERPSYRSLRDHQPQLIISGDGANSLLIERLDGRVQPQMPLRMQPLTQNQINGIKKWVNNGALNN
ncbi:MAG: c-type cytochrome domain-containing protein [Bacteroidota bacterium]